MSSTVRGFCVFRSGWTGYCVIAVTGGAYTTVTPDSHTSALEYAAAIMDAANAEFSSTEFKATVGNTGKIVLQSDQAFSLLFLPAGNAHGRLGFATDTYSLATGHTAEASHLGSVYPYESESMRYTLDQPAPPAGGFLLRDLAIWPRIPAIDWRLPDARVTGLRGVCLDVVAVLNAADTPAKISILIEDPLEIVNVNLGKVSCKITDPKTGWGSVSLEVAR